MCHWEGKRKWLSLHWLLRLHCNSWSQIAKTYNTVITDLWSLMLIYEGAEKDHILFGGQRCNILFWSTIHFFSLISGFFSLCLFFFSRQFPFLLSPKVPPHTLGFLLLSLSPSFCLPLIYPAVTVNFTMWAIMWFICPSTNSLSPLVSLSYPAPWKPKHQLILCIWQLR